jgi:LysM repeat protein
MPDYQPNPVARIVAVVALIAAFLLVIIVIATSGGESDGGDGDSVDQVEATGPTPKGQRAVEAGAWIVKEGDTLAQISEETGIDTDELIQLNPDIDPQALLQGQRVALK